MGQLKIKDNNDQWVAIPTGGVGVPDGGTAGQVLTKSSGTDYATEWTLPLSMKLLWTNPDPNAAFAAQTVSLDLSGYEMVMIEAITDSTSGSGYKANTIVPFGKSRIMVGSSGNVTRGCNITATGIAFETGYVDSTAGTKYAAPLKIYGIKGIT